jgi:pimeloyl-ACP methyl ester carboxylesterase
MRLAYWPALGGGLTSFAEVAPVLATAGVESFVVDPRYGTRADWSLSALATELAATGADAYAGSSWGGAVAACAALLRPPRALVLFDGGHFATTDFGDDAEQQVEDVRRSYEEEMRWPTWDAYLDWSRSTSPRWNDAIETMAREGAELRDGEVRFAYSFETLEAIVRAYQAYDAVATLRELSPDTRVLVAAADLDEDRRRLARRAEELLPHGDVRLLASGHDVVWDKGAEIGHMVAEWLRR